MISPATRAIPRRAHRGGDLGVGLPFLRHELIEEVKPSWVDDFPLVNTIVRNTISHTSENTDPEDLILTSIYKDAEDQTFAIDLLKSVAIHDEELTAQLKESLSQ